MDHIDKRESFLKLHLSVLLAGFTGLFGKLITLNEVDIVWYRMFFTALILLVFTGLPRVGWKKFLQIAGCGALLGLHWMLFYGSIKMSNVSIGVVCYAMVGFFTAFFEPLVFRRRVAWIEVLFACFTLCGLLCIFSFDTRYRSGILVGMLSSAAAALYTIFNKKVSVGVRSRTMLMYQMAGGLLGVSLIIPVYLWCFPSDTPVMVLPDGANLWWMLCHALSARLASTYCKYRCSKVCRPSPSTSPTTSSRATPSSWLSCFSAKPVSSTSPSTSALPSSF